MLRCAFFTFSLYSAGIVLLHAFCPGRVCTSLIFTRSVIGRGLWFLAPEGMGFTTFGLVGSCCIAQDALRAFCAVVGAGTLKWIPCSSSGLEMPTMTSRVRVWGTPYSSNLYKCAVSLY